MHSLMKIGCEIEKFYGMENLIITTTRIRRTFVVIWDPFPGPKMVENVTVAVYFLFIFIYLLVNIVFLSHCYQFW